MFKPLSSRAILLALAASLFCACSKESSAPPAAALDAAARERAAAIAHPAWLRDRLPEHTVAYLRIPSAWGLLSAPNGRALDPALASEAHVNTVRALREAVRSDKLIADSGFEPVLGLLLSDMASPVEFALVDNSDIANPASSVFASVQMDVADVAAMNARTAALSKQSPLLKAPLDADGRGELASGGFVRFDPAARRLFVLGGMSASASGIDALIKQTAQTHPAEMAVSEREIDASGQGLFAWVKLKGVNGMAGAYLPQDPKSALLRDFVQKSESFAAGWGSVDGRGRLQVRLRAPQARLLGYFAPNAPAPALRIAGQPRWAADLRLPDAVQWQRLIDQLDADYGAGTRARFDGARTEATAKLGIDPIEFARLIGPALVAYEDDAGVYTALQVKDRAALHALIAQMEQKHGWHHETIRSGGAEMHHLRIPGLDAGKPEDNTAVWLRAYARIGSHLYWVEDGDWLIFGSVPQALADRAAATLDTALAGWQKAQGYDAASSLLGVSGITRNAQRTSYYAYLGGLQMAADLVGANIDLAALPSASALQLPVQGATGIALQAGPDFLGLNLHYEGTPLDALAGGSGSMTAIAVAGVLAAVAVPAYQDYGARAQVSAVLAATSSLKVSMVESYMVEGTFPDSLDEAGLNGVGLGEAARYVESFQFDHGAIVLQFGGEAAAGLSGQTLVLSPYQLGSGVVWRCGQGAVDPHAKPLSKAQAATTAPARLLPQDCR